MRLQFKTWLEAYADTHTEPFVPSDQMQQLQQMMLDKAIRRGDDELAHELRTRIRNQTPKIGTYDDDDLLDIDIDDDMNVKKPKPPPVDPEDWRERKKQMYHANMRRGDVDWAKSNLDDYERGPSPSINDDDDEESHVLHGLPPGSKVGVKLHKPQGSTHDTMSPSGNFGIK